MARTSALDLRIKAYTQQARTVDNKKGSMGRKIPVMEVSQITSHRFQMLSSYLCRKFSPCEQYDNIYEGNQQYNANSVYGNTSARRTESDHAGASPYVGSYRVGTGYGGTNQSDHRGRAENSYEEAGRNANACEPSGTVLPDSSTFSDAHRRHSEYAYGSRKSHGKLKPDMESRGRGKNILVNSPCHDEGYGPNHKGPAIIIHPISRS